MHQLVAPGALRPAWSQAYRDDGLIVIGVHTPEFSFEHDIEGVRRATKERAIDYPVVIDNDYEVWTAFGNRSRRRCTSPTRRVSFATTTSAKGATRNSSTSFSGCSASSASSSPSRAWASTRPTGTTWARWRHISATDAAANSRLHGAQRWTSIAPTPSRRACASIIRASRRRLDDQTQYVVLEVAGGSIAFRFMHATHISCCLRSAGEPIPFRVLLDGEAPGRSHGVDVDEDGRGVIRDARMY